MIKMQSDIGICSVFDFTFVAFSGVRFTSPNSTMMSDLYLELFPNGLQKQEEDQPEGMVLEILLYALLKQSPFIPVITPPSPCHEVGFPPAELPIESQYYCDKSDVHKDL